MIQLDAIFTTSADSGLYLHGVYNSWLVALSIVIACISSVLAMQVASMVKPTMTTLQRKITIASGSLALGIGIWSMHFIGMLAFHLHTSVSYNLPITLFSVIPSILASWVAFNILIASRADWWRVLVSGILIGGGIGIMHYIGMAAMQMTALLRFDPLWFVLSVLVAIALACLALWIRFGLISNTSVGHFQQLLLSGIVMGCAIAGMHYIGMAAARFMGSPVFATPLPPSGADILAILITIGTLLLSLAVLLANLFIRYRGILLDEATHIKRQQSESEQLLNSVIEHIPSMIFMKYADDLRFALLNKAGEQLLGYSRTEMFGKNDYDFFPKEQADFFTAKDREVLAQGFKNIPEELVDTRTQGRRILHSKKIALCDSQGKPQYLLGISHDITEQKQIEKQLLDNAVRLSAVLDTVMEGILTINEHGIIESMNPAAEHIFGYSAAEVVGHNVNMLMPEPYHSEHDNYLKDYRTTGKAHIIGTGREVMGQRKDGSTFQMELSVGKMQLGEGQFFTGIVRDITARKQAEQALIAARDEANRANRTKSEFLSSMSHELRTPMNAVLGFAQLLEYDDELNEDQQENVHAILKSGRHLLELINEVLDLAKIEAGHIDLSLEPVEVSPMIEECLSMVFTLASKRNIRLNCDGLKGTAVRADRIRFKQVLLNLISNAIKYNRESGSVTLNVQVEGEERLRIKVIDTGSGIPNERLAELFQPFNRLGAEGSNIEGTGIGLTITRRIIEMMGGTVDVESEFGVGSTFWIELPLEFLPTLDSKLQSSEAIANGDNTRLVQETGTTQHLILYIEDNPLNIKLVAQILSHRKHIHLLTAHLPELGIELAQTRRPELILLDINMPGMNGYQVLEVLKTTPCLKDIPVIAITANAMPHDIDRGKAAGFSDYLTKPLNVKQFLDTIDHYLQNHTEHSR